MSVFWLKIIALASMLTDHLGYVLSFTNFEFASHSVYMRVVGRMAFPIYVFLMVNGARKSSDRKKYMGRMALFAFVSQLPFSLIFNHSNFSASLASGAALSVGVHDISMLPFCLLSLLLLYFTGFGGRPNRVFLWLAAALILPFITLRYGELLLVGPDLNVFYTLGISLAAVCLLDDFFSPGSTMPLWKKLLLALSVAAAAIYILPRSDYGYNGLALALLIFAAHHKRLLQSAVMALWCWMMYGYSGIFLTASLAPCILILLYNGKRGKAFKMGFYLIYPLHLLILFFVGRLII